MIYFALIVTSFSSFGRAYGDAAFANDHGFSNLPDQSVLRYYLPLGQLLLILLAGFLIATITMHLGRWIGRLHGRYAKMLVSNGLNSEGRITQAEDGESSLPLSAF